jgi:hypothetical protein
MYVDGSGEVFMLLTAAIGAVVGGVVGAVTSYVNTGKVEVGAVLAGAAIGGAIGLTLGAAAGVVLAGSAVASTSAVIAGGTTLVNTVAAGGLAAGGTFIANNVQQAFSSGTVVIGEGMARVIRRADEIGAEIYEGFGWYGKINSIPVIGNVLANIFGKIDNAVWLLDKMIRNYRIIDVGPISETIRSSSYMLEKILTFLYKNIEHIGGCK